MGHSLSIHENLNIAFFRFEGEVNVQEAKKAFLDYVADTRFRPDRIMITDARDVNGTDATFQETFGGVSRLFVHLGLFETKVLSIVLVGDSTMFGVVRMLGEILDFSSKIHMKPVWSEAEALERAGREEHSFEQLFGH